MIRMMLLEDVSTIVDVHLQSFSGFFLTFLGPAFLAELYAGILTDPSGIAFVAQDNGQIVGFVAGAGQPASFYARGCCANSGIARFDDDKIVRYKS